MERKKLAPEEIDQALSKVNEWEAFDNSLKKRFTFPNFVESLAFVNKVGDAAEVLDHHPDITFGWGYAEIAITTHDKGGITTKDFELAGRIDDLIL